MESETEWRNEMELEMEWSGAVFLRESGAENKSNSNSYWNQTEDRRSLKELWKSIAELGPKGPKESGATRIFKGSSWIDIGL